MSMIDQDWRDARRDLNRGGRFGLAWFFVFLGVVALVGVGIWGFSVVTSGPKGQGDAVIEKNSAENWLEAQARFEQNYAEIKAADVKIDNAYKIWQANPSDKTLQQTYTGLTSYCLGVVADYNADARSYLSEDFRAVDLPDQIDTEGNLANPATDCKESK